MVALRQQWPNTLVDVIDPAGVWSNAIDPLSIDQIRHGIKSLATITADFALTCAQFRALALTYSPPLEAAAQPEPVTENQILHHAVLAKYLTKYVAATGGYRGDFDIDQFVDQQLVPAAQSAVDDPWQNYIQIMSANLRRILNDNRI